MSVLGRNTKDDRTEARTPTQTATAVPSHSVIGKGMSISGDCVTEGHVRVEGTIVGSLTANGIELADGGVVDGAISVPSTGKPGQSFVVSGHVTGRARAHIVDVKKSGTVLGGIEAEEATIHGTVKGGVTVRHRLAVAATAVLDGDVSTDRLVMDEGGRVNGTIRMGREAKGSSSNRSGADARADAPAEPPKTDADGGTPEGARGKKPAAA